MLGRTLQQLYVPTKKDPISALPNPYLSCSEFTPIFTTCARSWESTLLNAVPVEDLDGRCLQISTAECWELLLPTTHATASPQTTDHSQQHSAKQHQTCIQRRYSVPFPNPRLSISRTESLRDVQSEPPTRATWPRQWRAWARKHANNVQQLPTSNSTASPAQCP